MRAKKVKTNSPNTELKKLKPDLKAQTKIKSKKLTRNNCISNKPPPKKLSTLDNLLQRLYQSHSLKNEFVGHEVDAANQSDNNNTTAKRSAKLFVRLEKLNLPQQENNLTHENSILEKNESNRKPQRKVKSDGTPYIDRSSEYIRLHNKEYKCAKCDFTHCHLVSIRTHFDKQHNEQEFVCELCPFKTRQQYYFNSHVRYHSKPDTECPHCKKMIKWFSYKMHIKTHERSDKTEYKCTCCDYRSYNHANVKRHMLVLHKNPHELQTFNCDACNYVTVLEERLKQHKKVVHSKEGIWLTCSQCEYTTRNKSHLTRHVNLHKDKNLQCPECPQLFNCKDNLKSHIKRKHTDLNAKQYYYCELCPKEEQYKTTEKGNLARHILAHRTLDEIEIFACHKCPYLGKSRNALKTHLINAHLPEMHQYKCQVCGYSTSTKSRYEYHVRDVHGKPRSEKYKISRKNLTQNGDNTEESLLVNREANPEAREEDTAMDVKDEADDLFENTESIGNNNDVAPKQVSRTDLWAKPENQQE